MAQIKEVIPNAFVFTLGNEVVHGRIVNTNASYLGRRLSILGFNVLGNISLIDDIKLISYFLNLVIKKFKPVVIVTTGGLGPTYDDRTLEAVALATGKKLVINQDALKSVKEKYEYAGLELSEDRLKMAYLPEGAIAIPNYVGTAPGSWLELPNEKSIIISLPGVPKELTEMWEKWVEPRLSTISPKKFMYETKIRIEGVPESTLAPVLKEIVRTYSDVYVKSHPKGHETRKPIIEIYIMTYAESKEKAKEIVDEVKEKILDLLMNKGIKFNAVK